jgi:predicted TPR repeat methyltransferase
MRKDIREYVKEIADLFQIKSVLDVGCGSDPVSFALPATIEKIGIDIDEHGLANARGRGLRAIKLDMLSLHGSVVGRFDMVLFTDSLEHICYMDALNVMQSAITVANKIIVAFIPEGAVGDNDWDKGPHKHRHHWSLGDCEAAGFNHIVRLVGYHGTGHAFLAIWCPESYGLKFIKDQSSGEYRIVCV